MIRFAKAHAYGNDFLYVEDALVHGVRLDALAREMCDRHTGVGADGLIVYTTSDDGASMRLFNADGGRAEVSGNGVRALGALLARPGAGSRSTVTIRTDGGEKALTLLADDGARKTFRAAMGLPTNLDRSAIDAGGESLEGVTLRIGNPQLIVLGPLPDDERFERLGRALERHERFPDGTN
ncbi:MAG: diaminopimelate epimerase, partial [Vicinamibacterales bacterium]